MTITRGYELATDAQFRELSNFSTPPRAGRITAIEASGQVRVETDDPDGGDVLAWPLNGFTYAVNDVVYLAFAVNSPDSAIVIGSLGHLPLLAHAVLIPFDHGSELTGLGDDDHTQYLLLAGRAGGQVVTGLTTGEALKVYRNLTAASTDSPVIFIHQDHASDDQPALKVEQDGAANIAEFYDGAVVAWVFADGGLAGNVATPLTQLDISTDATPADRGLMVEQHSSNTASAPAYFRKSRGTRALPTTIGSADFIMALAAQGYDGSAYITPGGMAFKVVGAVSAGVVPVDILFIAGSVDDTSFTNEVARFTNGGKLLVGVTSAGASRLGIQPGTSSNDAAVGGTVYETRTVAGNVGIGEDDLASYSVPANTLSADGMSVWFEASGSCAANLNAKTLRIRFGTAGTNLVISATVTGSGGGAKWIARGRVVRTAAATQKSYAEVTGSNVTTTVDVVTGLNQTLSGAVTFKITGEATANNDIVLETFRVEWGDANT